MGQEEEFKSITWLRSGIKFILEVFAALSILLLTVGLVSASWNFLDKDQLFGKAPMLQSLWGLDQALAIDANLPLVFVYLFLSAKAHDWIKTAIYAVIGIMLLFVAATILDMESLRQALNISLDAAASQVHVSMGVITQVRSFATIGLVAMSGLTWTVMLVKHDSAETTEPDPAPAPAPEPEPAPKTEETKAAIDPAATYAHYLKLVDANPGATRKWLAEQLGVGTSTISNYRRKQRSEDTNHDESFPSAPAEEAYATANA